LVCPVARILFTYNAASAIALRGTAAQFADWLVQKLDKRSDRSVQPSEMNQYRMPGSDPENVA